MIQLFCDDREELLKIRKFIRNIFLCNLVFCHNFLPSKIFFFHNFLPFLTIFFFLAKISSQKITNLQNNYGALRFNLFARFGVEGPKREISEGSRWEKVQCKTFIALAHSRFVTYVCITWTVTIIKWIQNNTGWIVGYNRVSNQSRCAGTLNIHWSIDKHIQRQAIGCKMRCLYHGTMHIVSPCFIARLAEKKVVIKMFMLFFSP